MIELCNYCGYERVGEYKFCPMCGNSFENVCSNCFAIVDLDKFNYCPDCGKQLRDLLLFFSLDEITHPVENKALLDVESKFRDFARQYRNLASADLQVGFNSLDELKLVNYNSDRQIAFLINYFVPEGLQIFLKGNCDSKYEIYSNTIIFSEEFYMMLSGIERRWWIGHLIGHLVRKHYYYRHFKLCLEGSMSEYSEYPDTEDLIFSMRYLEQISDLSADRIASLFVNEFSVFLSAIYIERNGVRPTFEYDVEKGIMESFRENPFMLKRINEMREFLISAKIVKVLKRLKLIYSLEIEEEPEKPKPVLDNEEIMKSLKQLVKNVSEADEKPEMSIIPEQYAGEDYAAAEVLQELPSSKDTEQIHETMNVIENMIIHTGVPAEPQSVSESQKVLFEEDEFPDGPAAVTQEVEAAPEIRREPAAGQAENHEITEDEADDLFETTTYFDEPDEAVQKAIPVERPSALNKEVDRDDGPGPDEPEEPDALDAVISRNDHGVAEVTAPVPKSSGTGNHKGLRYTVFNSGNQRIDVFHDEVFHHSIPVAGLKYFSSGKVQDEPGYWVTDYKNHKIQFYDFSGNIRVRFGEHGTKAGQFNFPICACQVEERLYISDSWNNRIVVTDLAGNFESVIRRSDDLYLSYPSYIWYSEGLQTMFLTDSGNNRIIVMKTDGEVMHVIGSNLDLDSPVCAKSLDGERIMISDCGNHRLAICTPEGYLIEELGEYGKKSGKFDTPEGIELFGDRIYAANSWNHRIEIFTLEGEYLGSFGKYGVSDGLLNSPTDILVDNF